jgi:hypothetical protein
MTARCPRDGARAQLPITQQRPCAVAGLGSTVEMTRSLATRRAIRNTPSAPGVEVLADHSGQQRDRRDAPTTRAPSPPTHEREIRTAMREANTAHIPLYPEPRACASPTTEHQPPENRPRSRSIRIGPCLEV